MNSHPILFLFFFGLLLNVAKAQTADSIIHQYIEAIGGLKNWQKITNRCDSSLTYATNDIYAKEPKTLNSTILVNYVDKTGRFRTQFYVNNELESIRTYDKAYTYSYLFQNGTRLPLLKAPSDKSDNYREISDVFELLNAQKVTFVRKEQSDTIIYNVLRVVKMNNEESLWYFDTQTGFLYKKHIDEPQVRFVTYYQNYQKIDNVLVPMYQETRNSEGIVVMKFEKVIVKFNLKLPKHFYQLE
ncbi:MAG: hypothetical protein MUE85_15165 [Microscillaceae bacterium]|jgi:hypothetical protein|nr:hypothetical protein [Microscillaceae bacterium]